MISYTGILYYIFSVILANEKDGRQRMILSLSSYLSLIHILIGPKSQGGRGPGARDPGGPGGQEGQRARHRPSYSNTQVTS
jgi:hypothetical protein